MEKVVNPMLKSRSSSIFPGCALAGCLWSAALALPASAQTLPEAAVDCAALENPLFIEAGDTQMRMLGDLGRRLRDATVPMTLVYLPRSTCTLAENVFTAKATTEVM